MFKKEAKIYALINYGFRGKNSQRVFTAKIDYQKGAEFGYNKANEDADKMKSRFLEICNLKDMRIAELEKANEWHNLLRDADDLPKENMKQVMVVTNHNQCLMGWYCIHQKTWWSSDCPDPDDRIETDDILKVKVIKWKEIILPKESE